MHDKDELELCSQVLATNQVAETHTGEDIAHEIQSIVDDFCIKNMVSIVHDNAANMDVAILVLDIPNSSCTGHTLQLCVNDGLKLSELLKTLA